MTRALLIGTRWALLACAFCLPLVLNAQGGVPEVGVERRVDVDALAGAREEIAVIAHAIQRFTEEDGTQLDFRGSEYRALRSVLQRLDSRLAQRNPRARTTGVPALARVQLTVDSVSTAPAPHNTQVVVAFVRISVAGNPPSFGVVQLRALRDARWRLASIAPLTFYLDTLATSAVAPAAPEGQSP